MFTGLVEEVGTLERVTRYNKGLRLSVTRPAAFNDIKIGDSISIDGVCLTITDLDGQLMSFDVIQESLGRTTLGDLRKGDKLNLERALKVDQRLAGHFVTGHIDCKAVIKNLNSGKDNAKLEIVMPKGYKRYLTPKGCIAIDGVSLTVGEIVGDSFFVYLIPHTLQNTTLGLKKKGAAVNIEVDMLARYAFEHRVEEKNSRVSMGFLKEHGFM